MKRIEMSFLCVFLIMIMMPLGSLNLHSNVSSKTENRMLCNLPSLFDENGKINRELVAGFEDWFNDHIGFREWFVYANGAIQYYVFGRMDYEPYYLGEHGELCGANEIADYCHTNTISEEEAKEYADAYDFIGEYLKANDCQLYYLTGYEKYSIYPEQFPSSWNQRNGLSRTDCVMAALSKENNVNVIPVKQLLLYEKAKYSIFGEWNDPWHWTDRGSFIVYKSLMDEINTNNDDKLFVLSEDDFDIDILDKRWPAFYYVKKKDYQEVFKLKNPKAILRNDFLSDSLPKADNFFYYYNIYSNNDDVVVCCNDSYMRGFPLLYGLAESFKRVISYDQTMIMDGNLIKLVEEYHPNILILENAERNHSYVYGKNAEESLRVYSYTMGDSLTGENLMKHCLKGLSVNEDGFNWTDGNNADFLFYVGKTNDKTIMCKINVVGTYGQQRINIKINGNQVFADTLMGKKEVEFVFSSSILDSEFVQLNIELPDSTKPIDKLESYDSRSLGIQIREMSLVLSG